MNKKLLLSASLLLNLPSAYAGSSNLIVNNTFDTSDEITFWSDSFGSELASWNSVESKTADGSGSLQVGDNGGGTGPTTTVVTTCVSPVAGGMSVVNEIGVSYKVLSGSISGSCTIATLQSTSLECGNPTGVWDTGTAVGASPDGTWKTTTTGAPAFASSTISAQIRLLCTNTNNPVDDDTPFTILFDEPFLRQPTTPVELLNFNVD